jgi:hypothetical protein
MTFSMTAALRGRSAEKMREGAPSGGAPGSLPMPLSDPTQTNFAITRASLTGDFVAFNFDFSDIRQSARMFLDLFMRVTAAVAVDCSLVLPGTQ